MLNNSLSLIHCIYYSTNLLSFKLYCSYYIIINSIIFAYMFNILLRINLENWYCRKKVYCFPGLFSYISKLS